MATLIKARSYMRRHPDEATADAVGLAAICLMILLGFTVPALF